MKSFVLALVLGLSLIISTDTFAHFSNANYQYENIDATDNTTAISHAVWDGLLKKYVSSSGKVNYAGLKSQKTKLKGYLDALAKAQTSGLSKNEKLAFWINAYNAHTVYIILNKYPVSSIMKIDNGKVWTTRKLKIAGISITLSDIEKKKLIGGLKEPRIHFAINCAAASCPPLLNRAWKASTMNADLTAQTKKFINNKKYNTITKSSAKLSKIFEWYASDFGNVKTYINKYSTVKLASNAKISYNEYSWSLNKQ